MWRRNARLARDQREAGEHEARAREEELYPVVKASMGAVGDGRERKQVRLAFNLTSPKLNIFLFSRSVQSQTGRWNAWVIFWTGKLL